MAETSPSFTVTMNDGKSTQPEQPVPEPASKQLTWTDGKQTVKYTATAEMLPLHTCLLYTSRLSRSVYVS